MSKIWKKLYARVNDLCRGDVGGTAAAGMGILQEDTYNYFLII